MAKKESSASVAQGVSVMYHDRSSKQQSFVMTEIEESAVAIAGSFLRDAGNLTPEGKMTKLDAKDFDPTNANHRVFVILDIAHKAYSDSTLTVDLGLLNAADGFKKFALNKSGNKFTLNAGTKIAIIKVQEQLVMKFTVKA
jgi:hypothetical protein